MEVLQRSKCISLHEAMDAIKAHTFCIVRPKETFSDCYIERINTLGPSNTSSHIAAMALISAAGLDLDISLYRSFEQILDGTINSNGNALVIVPSAYSGIDAFFMSPRTSLIGCFYHDTPPYHIAWRQGDSPLTTGKRLIVATHPAPIGLLSRLLPGSISYDILSFHSTVAAAEAVMGGGADIALCNLETIKFLKMEYMALGVPINMTWNIFILKPFYPETFA